MAKLAQALRKELGMLVDESPVIDATDEATPQGSDAHVNDTLKLPDDHGPLAHPSLAADLAGTQPSGVRANPRPTFNPADDLAAKLNRPPESKKGMLANALLSLAPTGLAAAIGGRYAASGAAQGTAEAEQVRGQRQQSERAGIRGQLKDELDRQERERQAADTTAANNQNRRELADIVSGRAVDVQGLKNTGAADVQGLKSGTAETVAGINAEPRKAAVRATLLTHGLNEDGTPVDEAQLSVVDRAKVARSRAQDDLDKAKEDLVRAGNDPKSPKYQLALKTAGIAAERLALSQREYEMRAFGTAGGEALPGAIIGADGVPVGTVNAPNVRPTAVERNKGDMAKSASEQLNDIQSIIQKRPDVFGPLAGRKTNLEVWLGSEDPDAKAFISARDVASGHLAGTFGARSAQVISDLKDSIGQFKDNPEAALRGLAQVQKAVKLFESKGTPNVAGGKLASDVAPKIGEVRKGFKFLGGDPSKPESWKKQP